MKNTPPGAHSHDAPARDHPEASSRAASASALVLALASTASLSLTGAPTFGQDRIRLGVGDIEYRAPDSAKNKAFGAFGRGVREDTQAFVDMLTTALVKTDKFDVVERDRMQAVLEEQGMGAFGLTDGYDRLHLSGLDYAVIGAITEYGMITQAARFGGFTTAGRQAHMAVDIRVVDAEDGLTAVAETVSVVADASGGMAVNGVDMRGDETESHLLGRIMRMAARDITVLIVSSVYPIRVATQTETGDILLNYGNGLLQEGDALDVFSEGKSVIDPNSGEVLGSEEVRVARIEVVSAEARFSKARVIWEDASIDAGMIARMLSARADTPPNGQRIRRKIRR